MTLDVEIRRILMVTLGTLIFSVGVALFIVPATLVPSGLTGLVRMVQVSLETAGVRVNLGVLLVVFNIPIMMLGMKEISKTFVYYSILSIILQGIFIGVLEQYPGIFSDDILAASVLGGILIGVGAALTLKSGASTGGIDIIIQYISLKYQLSIGYIGIIINAIILALAVFFFDSTFAFYTLLSFVVTNMIIDRLHTGYRRVRLDILTIEGEAIKSAIIDNFIRGVTMQNAKGAYTEEHRTLLWMITQRHEVYDIKRLILDIDPDAFVTMTPVHHLNGHFHKTIIR